MILEPKIEELLPCSIPNAPPVPEGMRMFTIYRINDISGVSGAGKIIQGVLFADQKVTIQWLVGSDPGDTQVKLDWNRFIDTHIKSHPENGTIVTFANGEQLKFGYVYENPPRPPVEITLNDGEAKESMYKEKDK